MYDVGLTVYFLNFGIDFKNSTSLTSDCRARTYVRSYLFLQQEAHGPQRQPELFHAISSLNFEPLSRAPVLVRGLWLANCSIVVLEKKFSNIFHLYFC